ncbi:MAG: hypothetical protein AVDCRST_MAG72-1289 [uncultured Nocardioidaceae bacterium]|uniref:Uncharacterized protein n=1 Tax=uncultured Nocardioidaceae bacterium TaxID=253824 RepID=A0A6J4M4N7_9ACTN|nr:MAG: hypothetical protein AVDCRST_MAG72-1289 [uncultured Nocardioidaceae bacterium]
MKSVYRVLAFIIALGVAFQAAVMVFAIAGLGIWVDEGNSFDKAAVEALFDGELSFTGSVGMMLHGMNGMMVMPALALILLIVSFFAKVPGGVKWATAVLLAVVVQIALGIFGHSNAYFGLLHGVNALILFGLAVTAGMRVRRLDTAPARSASAPEREMV